MKNETKSDRLSFAQLGVLAGIIMEFLAVMFNAPQLKYWLEHKTELKKRLREVFKIVDEYVDIRIEWATFYKKNFDWEVDFSHVIIPTMPTIGKWRLLFIPKGMRPQLAFEVCTKLFKTSKYCDNLDDAIGKNIRTTGEHYAVWVRDEVEPDSETLGKSTRQADPDMKVGITLLEGIIFEIKYFTETGKHLNIKGVTFCSGSRISGGNVPSVSWSDGKFEVYWNDLDNSVSYYGIRSAV
ncbi:MAG: hypothetical protein NT068_02610 [Candidatus Nomurabacteria bacterium]|nr:hypothetical protein [Candidatus Nomurabacteria bacterium]